MNAVNNNEDNLPGQEDREEDNNIQGQDGPAEERKEEDPWQIPDPLPQVIIDDADLPDTMGRDDPCRMKLTFDEWLSAWTVKSFIANSPERENISDFMCAQIALIVEDVFDGDFDEDSLGRVDGFEAFRKEYLITDTVEEGCNAIEQVVNLFPEYFLFFGFDPEEGTYSFSIDMSKLDDNFLNFLKPERSLQTFMRGAYYLMHALAPDVEAIRKGGTGLMECLDMNNWKQKKIIKKVADELVSVYPNQHTMRHFHTGVIFNIMGSMLKKALPRHLRDRFVTGCSFEGSLSDTFLVPTVEVANQRMISCTQQALRKRYENQSLFSLH